MKKIITHLMPRHIDDMLAVAILAAKYGVSNENIIFKDQISEEELADPEIAVVDVGGSYDPKKRNFDHHQNSDLPCSFVLVLKDEFPEYYMLIEENPMMRKAIRFLDIKDRKGFHKALEETGEPASAYGGFLEKLLIGSPDAEIVKQIIPVIGQSFLTMLEKIKREKQLLKDVETINVDNLVVAVDRHGLNVGEIFKETKADVVIQKNVRDAAQTSIIRNAVSKKAGKLDFGRIFNDEFPKVFLHNTGFIAVVNRPIEDFTEETIRKVISRVTQRTPLPPLSRNESMDIDREM